MGGPRRSVLGALAVVSLGVALMLPSVFGGFLLDDHVHQAALDGSLPHGTASDELFRFLPGDAERTADLARRGLYPWWIRDGIKVAFFRPLSAALMRMEDSFWPDNATVHHLHSLAWWAALLAAAGLVFRRLFPGPVGWLALLLFALDESHIFPAGWIANRNALVALTPALLGLAAHVRWREEGWRPGLPLSAAGLAAGLLGGEAALSAAAFVVAYELAGAAGPPLRRLAALVPTGAVALAYLAVRAARDYGVTGSGIYVDPAADPLSYAELALVRVPALVGAALAGLSADFWIIEPSLRPVQVGVGAAAALVFAGLLRACWPALGAAERRHLRWLLLGGLLALLPVAATFPSDRLLLAAAVGYCPAIAVVLHRAWTSLRARSRWWLVAAGSVAVLVHLVLAPLVVVAVQLALVAQSHESLRLARAAPLPASPDRHVVLVWAPDHVVGLYLPLLAQRVGRPMPASWRPLSLAPFDHRVTRTADDALELEVLGGTMMTGLFERLYRDDEPPLRPGDVVDRGMIRVEILDAGPRGPTRVAFRFDRSLDDPSLALLAWIDGELRPLRPLEVGASIRIERTLGPAGF